MKFAVIETSGTQFAVSEGDVITLDNQPVEAEEAVTFDKVLLLVDENAVTVGKPLLTNISVKGTVINHEKGPKIRVAKYKAKTHQRKANGYRHQHTNVRITDILVS